MHAGNVCQGLRHSHKHTHTVWLHLSGHIKQCGDLIFVTPLIRPYDIFHASPPCLLHLPSKMLQHNIHWGVMEREMRQQRGSGIKEQEQGDKEEETGWWNTKLGQAVD